MNIAAGNLEQLNIEVPKSMLMEFVLNSLPPIFDDFYSTYNIQEHKWSLEYITSLCAQEEIFLNEVIYESKNLTSS